MFGADSHGIHNENRHRKPMTSQHDDPAYAAVDAAADPGSPAAAPQAVESQPDADQDAASPALDATPAVDPADDADTTGPLSGLPLSITDQSDDARPSEPEGVEPGRADTEDGDTEDVDTEDVDTEDTEARDTEPQDGPTGDPEPAEAPDDTTSVTAGDGLARESLPSADRDIDTGRLPRVEPGGGWMSRPSGALSAPDGLPGPHPVTDPTRTTVVGGVGALPAAAVGALPAGAAGIGRGPTPFAPRALPWSLPGLSTSGTPATASAQAAPPGPTGLIHPDAAGASGPGTRVAPDVGAPSPWSRAGAATAAWTAAHPHPASATTANPAWTEPGLEPGAGPSVPVTSDPRSRAVAGGARVRRGILIGAAVAVLALGAGFGGGALAVHTTDTNSAASTSPVASSQVSAGTSAAPAGSVQAVAQAVLPSVVSVVAASTQAEDEGSGVVLTTSGLILTNNHVIDGAKTITVQFNDGTTSSAKVVGVDATDDLAVLRVSGVSGLVPAVLGSSAALAVGQQVVAIGSPLGYSETVTTGIVSALNRPVRTSSAQGSGSATAQDTVLNAIQTDAAINPGNSGGPLVDMKGQVVGINSAIASLSGGQSGQTGSIGVGFAIPIDQAWRIAQEIIDTGHATHALLGATVRDSVDSTTGISNGATIVTVTPGGGAAKAGLKTGDVVTKVGSQPIGSSDALVATIRSTPPNTKVGITYLRDSASRTVSVALGSATG